MSSLPLIAAQSLVKSFGERPLFRDLSLQVGENERLALIGPNGSGKSTLLRMIAGLEDPDDGVIRHSPGSSVAYVAQEDVFDEQMTVRSILEETLHAAHVSDREIPGRLSVMSGRFGFSDLDAKVSTLSGGWRKRLSIARGFIVEPTLLLLDEPTNHLDIEGVMWLEEFMKRSRMAFVFVTHDRSLIENVAERVIEVNRRYPLGTISSNGGYRKFLENREGFLNSLQSTHEAMTNKARREEEWLRQGAKARTTKSKHRIAEAEKLISEVREIPNQPKRTALEFSASGRRTKELLKLDQVQKAMGGRTLFKGVSLTILPGVRLGVVGSNGSGKTTFIKLLRGDLQPDSGTIVTAPQLRIGFFDQARKSLDRNMTLKRALAPDGDGVVFNGQALHVVGWAKRFLFRADQLALPVSALSGGEQARVLLARLMLEETDILFFDEPTNDLDIETLEVIEESFLSYPGAIVLVTHDRFLLERVATTVLGISPSKTGLYGSYSQWEKMRSTADESAVRPVSVKPAAASPAVPLPAQDSIRLNSKEQRELGTIESKIEKAEAQLQQLQEGVASPETLADPVLLRARCEELAKQQELVDGLYARWEDLDRRRGLVKAKNA